MADEKAVLLETSEEAQYDENSDHAHELHRLLGTLFLPEIEFKEKSKISKEVSAQ